MSCIDFQRSYRIDKGKIANREYKGPINANGYPFISAKWTWKICNNNTLPDHDIQLSPWISHVSYGGVLQQELETDGAEEEEFDRGLLKYSTCRSSSLETYFDSENRIHSSSMKAAGRLKIGSQDVNRKIQCEDSDKVRARLEYSNDCKLEVSCTFSAKETRRLDMYSFISMY